MIAKTAGITSINRRVARSWFSNCPPYSIKITRRKLHNRQLGANFGHETAQIAPAHIRHDDNPALPFFTIDDFSTAPYFDASHCAERDVFSSGRAQRNASDGGRIGSIM